tara:strand:- start:6 stop:551 length:546 start_codon:yes stop_codon:yes gene_type:complete
MEELEQVYDTELEDEGEYSSPCEDEEEEEEQEDTEEKEEKRTENEENTDILNEFEKDIISQKANIDACRNYGKLCLKYANQKENSKMNFKMFNILLDRIFDILTKRNIEKTLNKYEEMTQILKYSIPNNHILLIKNLKKVMTHLTFVERKYSSAIFHDKEKKKTLINFLNLIVEGMTFNSN